MTARRACLGVSIGVMVAATGCGGGAANGAAARGATTPAGSCAPVTPGLSGDATLSGAAGRYDLTLVVDDGDGVRAASGALTLRARPEGRRTLGPAATPLDGFTDLEPGEVGALSMGRPDSQDPAAPGVLVIESDRPTGRNILLRLGSDANRTDRVAFDGPSTVLTVQRIEGDDLFGSWASTTASMRVTGHFCAVRSRG